MFINIQKAKIYLSYLFILSAMSLDISFGIEDLKLGNLFIIFVSFLAVFVHFFSYLQGKPFFTFGKSDLLYIPFVILCFFSVLWSPNIINTLFHSFLLLTIWLGVHSLADVPKIYIIRSIIRFGFIASVISILMIFISSEIAWQPSPSTDFPELRGIFNHQLRLGVFTWIVLALMLIVYINGKYNLIYRNFLFSCFVFLFILIVMLMSFSRLYSLFAVGALVFVFFLPRNFLVSKLYLTISVVLFTVFITGWDHIALYMQSIGQDATLTGRTNIWRDSIYLASYEPILGYGYPSFDDPMFDTDWPFYRPAHPHNSFIQSYFELGVVGFALTLMFVIANFLEVFSTPKNNITRAFVVFLFIFILLGSLTGGNYASKPSFLFVIFLFFLVLSRKNPQI